MTTNEWRKKYVRGLNTATLICVIFFGISHLIGFFFSGLKGLTAGIIPSVFAKKEVSSQIASTDAFTSIEGKLAIGDLKIMSGEEYRVEFKNYPSGKQPSVDISNGKLKIQSKGSSWSLFSSDFTADASLIITVPDTELDKVEMELDMGSIELQGLKAEEMTLEANMGSITLNNCKSEKLNMDADMGSISLEDVTFTKGSFDADMGAIDLIRVSFDSADCNAGMGSIDVDGSFNRLDADCSMGSIEVKNSVANAKYDLDTDLGSVTVNGADQGHKYRSN